PIGSEWNSSTVPVGTFTGTIWTWWVSTDRISSLGPRGPEKGDGSIISKNCIIYNSPYERDENIHLAIWGTFPACPKRQLPNPQGVDPPKKGTEGIPHPAAYRPAGLFGPSGGWLTVAPDRLGKYPGIQEQGT